MPRVGHAIRQGPSSDCHSWGVYHDSYEAKEHLAPITPGPPYKTCGRTEHTVPWRALSGIDSHWPHRAWEQGPRRIYAGTGGAGFQRFRITLKMVQITEHVGDRDENLTQVLWLGRRCSLQRAVQLGQESIGAFVWRPQAHSAGGMRRAFWKLRPPCTALSLGGSL